MLKSLNHNKKSKKFSLGAIFIGVIAVIAVSFVYTTFHPDINKAMATSYSWIQSSWAGGSGQAGPVTTTTTSYYSADSGVSAGSGGVTLTSASQSFLDDYNNTDNSNPTGTSGGGFTNGTCQSGCASSDANNASVNAAGVIKLTSVFSCGDNVTYNSTTYKTYQAASGLCWFVTNLQTTLLNDGTTSIPANSNNGFYYPNNSAGNASYGLMYYYTFVNTYKNSVCPSGWRLPTLAEATSDLVEVINSGGETIASQLAGRWASSAAQYFGIYNWIYAINGSVTYNFGWRQSNNSTASASASYASMGFEIKCVQ